MSLALVPLGTTAGTCRTSEALTFSFRAVTSLTLEEDFQFLVWLGTPKIGFQSGGNEETT